MKRFLVVALFMAGCGGAAAVATPSPTLAPLPSPSADVFAAACGVAREEVQAISEEMMAMLDAMTRSDLEAELRHRDKAHDLAVAAIRALPEGYKDNPALADFHDRVHDVMTVAGPLPDARASSNAAIELMGTGRDLATCSGAAAAQ